MFRCLAGALLLALALWLSRSWWLGAAGRLLVRDDGPARAEIAVVLGGDFYGYRILKGAELVRAGYVPLALVSGAPGLFGFHEDELAIAFAVRQGCRPEWFTGYAHEALSTEEEAYALIPELQRRQVRRYLLVTSNYHTARAARTFASVARQLRAPLEMRVVAAPDKFFEPDRWWQSRQARKAFLLEWSKTLAAVVGL